MRNMLAFVAALVLTVAGVGLYLDWYHIRTGAPGTGRRTVNIDINTEKIGGDLREGGEYIIEEGGAKLQEILEKSRKEEGTPRPEGNKNATGPENSPASPRPGTKQEEAIRSTGVIPPPHPEF